MRALLVVNPKATATSARARDVLARALASELKLDVMETAGRGHASDLAAQAVADEIDLVVTLGGDGTVNEVVNGMLATGTGLQVPALAAVPGGSANVFTRSLGLSRDPVEATAEILEALRDGRRRRIGLGRVGNRYFTFCAGIGFDAEVVREVEARRTVGHRATPSLYVRTAVEHYFTGTDRRHATLTLREPGVDPVDGLFLAIVSNTTPWTYLGGRPVDPNPRASFDLGLDLTGLRRLGVTRSLRAVRSLLTCTTPRGRSIVHRHDARDFEMVAERPVAVQVDGEYIGEHEQMVFRSVGRALSVVA